MANRFLDLPMPVGNGAGASVDTSSLGPDKTVSIGGAFPGAVVEVQASIDGASFRTVASFSVAGKKEIKLAALEMRVNVKSRGATFAANADVAAEEEEMLFRTFALPAGNGDGDPLNVGALGDEKTLVATGAFQGVSLTVMTSEDGTDYVPCASFSDKGGIVHLKSLGKYMIIRARGRTSLPFSGAVHVGGPATGAGDFADIPEGTITLFVRNSGDDSNDGSLANPLATLEEATRRLVESRTNGLRQVIDATGFVDNAAGDLALAFPQSVYRYDFDFTRPGGLDDAKDDFFDTPIELRADPTYVRDVTVTAVNTDADTQLVTLDVSDVLAVDELKGKFISVAAGVNAVVKSNTAGNIVVASYVAIAPGTYKAYEQSCVINRAMQVVSDAFVLFNGIKFGSELRYNSGQLSVMYRCAFDGTDFFMQVDGNHQLDGCYHEGGFFRSDGAAWGLTGCVFQGVEFAGHGTGGKGLADIAYCIADDCTPLGEGNFESATMVEIANTLITNARSHGIHRQSPFASRTTRVRIDNAAGDGIHISSGGGYHKCSRVVGAGNAGFGVALHHGAQALDQGNNSIAGVGGEIELGGSTTTWAAVGALAAGASLNDLGAMYPEMCRFF